MSTRKGDKMRHLKSEPNQILFIVSISLPTQFVYSTVTIAQSLPPTPSHQLLWPVGSNLSRFRTFVQTHHTARYSRDLSVLWLDKVGEGLWLGLEWVDVTVVKAVGVVVVVVSVVLWADVLHLVDGATLWAALNWALARHLWTVSMRSVSYGTDTTRASGGQKGN